MLNTHHQTSISQDRYEQSPIACCRGCLGRSQSLDVFPQRWLARLSHQTTLKAYKDRTIEQTQWHGHFRKLGRRGVLRVALPPLRPLMLKNQIHPHSFLRRQQSRNVKLRTQPLRPLRRMVTARHLKIARLAPKHRKPPPPRSHARRRSRTRIHRARPSRMIRRQIRAYPPTRRCRPRFRLLAHQLQERFASQLGTSPVSNRANPKA